MGTMIHDKAEFEGFENTDKPECDFDIHCVAERPADYKVHLVRTNMTFDTPNPEKYPMPIRKYSEFLFNDD
eukprot:731922-Amorphochlora_amoeboformis.AAC.1